MKDKKYSRLDGRDGRLEILKVRSIRNTHLGGSGENWFTQG